MKLVIYMTVVVGVLNSRLLRRLALVITVILVTIANVIAWCRLSHDRLCCSGFCCRWLLSRSALFVTYVLLLIPDKNTWTQGISNYQGTMQNTPSVNAAIGYFIVILLVMIIILKFPLLLTINWVSLIKECIYKIILTICCKSQLTCLLNKYCCNFIFKNM